MKRRGMCTHAVLVLTLVLALAGCGAKGDLYLPEEASRSPLGGDTAFTGT